MEYWRDLARKASPGLAWATLENGLPAPLFHGFVLPRHAFQDMMAFVAAELGGLVRALGYSTDHLAGTIERACAVWIAAAVADGRLGPVLKIQGCTHNHDTQRLADVEQLPLPPKKATFGHLSDTIVETIVAAPPQPDRWSVEEKSQEPKFSAGLANISHEDNTYGTDKVTTHSYGDLYDAVCSAYSRSAPLDILELGTYSGAFLHALADFFPCARLAAVDIRLDRVTYAPTGRMTLVEHDATDPGLVGTLQSKGFDAFDIIIDDASHRPVDQVQTLRLCAPLLKPGGTYVIEDIEGAHAEHVRAAVDDVARALGLQLEWHDLRHVKGRFDDIIAVLRRPL